MTKTSAAGRGGGFNLRKGNVMMREAMRLLMLTGMACGGAVHAAEAPIEKLVIKGDAAVLKLSADDKRPYQLDLNKSNWDAKQCSAQVRREGGVVTITVKLNNKLMGAGCGLEIAGNLKPGKQVELGLAAVKGSIRGVYSAIRVDSKAVDLTLEGKAASLSMSADAIRAQAKGAYDKLAFKGQALTLAFEGRSRDMAFDGQAVKAKVRLTDAKPSGSLSLDATTGKLALTLPKSATLQYEVRGAAASVDSKLPSTAGAPLKLSARGQALKVAVEAD